MSMVIENGSRSRGINDSMIEVMAQIGITIKRPMTDDYGIPTIEAMKVFNPKFLSLLYILAVQPCEEIRRRRTDFLTGIIKRDPTIVIQQNCDGVEDMIELPTPEMRTTSVVEGTNNLSKAWSKRNELVLSRNPKAESRGYGRYSGRK